MSSIMGGGWSRAGADVAVLLFLSDPYPSEGRSSFSCGRQDSLAKRASVTSTARHPPARRRAGVRAAFQRNNKVAPAHASRSSTPQGSMRRSSHDSVSSQDSFPRRRSGSGDSGSGMSATPSQSERRTGRRRASKESTLGLIAETQ